jgi:hypothetical protein
MLSGSCKKMGRRMTMKKQAELVVGFICVVLWILLFGAGMMVPSETYRKSLEQSFTVSNFLIAGLLYTYTNVAMLTCLAGLIAGISSRLTFREYEVDKAHENSAQAASTSMAYRRENPLSSMLRSFVVFLAYVAGVAIGAPGGTEVLSNTTADQYARVAALLSLTGFAVGFDPTLLGSFLSKLPNPLRKTG